jgi:hypothetical protein
LTEGARHAARLAATLQNQKTAMTPPGDNQALADKGRTVAPPGSPPAFFIGELYLPNNPFTRE